jgi:outer membrane murein-binding lipoprotein Lpp
MKTKNNFFNWCKITLMTLPVAAMMTFAGCYDDNDLWNDVNDLKQRVQTLEDKVNRMNSEIDAMQTIVDVLNDGRVITDVRETADGYTFTFSGGSTITINHGAPGADAPIIGVGVDNGVYYWTLTTEGTTSWLTNAQGEKLPVTGATPVMGVDAAGYWTVDGERITGANGDPVKAVGEDGDSFFSSVTQNETAVTFTLANGTVLVVPKAENLQLTVACGGIFIKQGETATYTVSLSGAGDIIITKPDGWRASIQNGNLSVTAPPAANTYAEKDGTISITVVGKNATVNKTITVSARDYTHLIDFEDPRVADYLAGPTFYGDNLYSSYTGIDRYYGYDDAATGLFMMINDPYETGDPDFYSGGIAISQWNNMTAAGHTNQCSVYYSDATTGKGGYKGSNTFAVHFGYNDPMYMGDGRSYITFYDDTKECIFDHFYVTNNTYAVLSMTRSDQFGKVFTYEDKDWFKLVIEGIDKSGNSTGFVEFYMADFRTPSSPGIITEWTPVDLSSLGKVTAIRFDMQSSDTGQYGMNTPAYFCFDNLAVKL